MPSSFTTNLRLELQATGENRATWGVKANQVFTKLEAAVAGNAEIALSDADYTLTTANGSSDEASNAILTFTGALTAQRSIIVPSVTKLYLVNNATTGGFSLNVRTSTNTTQAVVPAGRSTFVYCDGSVCTAQLISGSYPGIVGTGALNSGSITSGFGNINIGASTFTGNGSGLTSLNASNIGSGTLPAARLSGSYTGIVGTGALNAGSITFGFGNINIGTSTFTGNGSGLTSLNASQLTTGTLNNARLSGDYSFNSLTLSGNISMLNGSISIYGSVGNPGFNISDNLSGWKMNDSPGGSARLDIVSEDQWAILLKRVGSNGQIMQFRRTGSTGVGSISVTTTATAFNTSSDERKKEDLQPIDTSILDQIEPFDFRWKKGGSRGQGFMAQRVHGLIPGFATHNTDDGQDEWEADYSKIIPLLTAVVKEQRQTIADLTKRVADLEALVSA